MAAAVGGQLGEEYPAVPADDSAVRARALRRAMRQPDRYLAAALAEWTDEALATELGADPHRMWQLRLASYPRADPRSLTIQAYAALLETTVEQLTALLQRRGVIP
jgi:hypothetical protein